MNQVEVKRRQIETGAYVIGLINILIFGKILGNGGIAYLMVALECFAFVWTLSAGALADTLGRMLRARNSKGQYRNTLCVRRRVIILQGCIGIICSILFVACAELVAHKVFNVTYSTFIMMVLAPALFLRMISSVLMGYFQGEGSELPNAVAAPLRQIVLMGLGLLFVNLLGAYGSKVSNLLGDEAYTAMYGGVGIAIALDLTELLILLFLGLITLGSRQSLMKRGSEGMKQTDSLASTVRILYGSMWIPMLIKLFELLPIGIGTIFYRKSVSDVGKFAENYGLLGGKYAVICGIPILFICIQIISMNARTVGAFRKEDYRNAKSIFQSGLHIVVVHGLFFAAFVAVMAEQLAGMLCGNKAEQLTDMLRYGSVLILLAVLFFYFSRLLMLMGRKYPLLGCLGLMNILFIIGASILLNIGKAGVMSLIYAAMIAVGISCIVLGVFCCRLLHTAVEWLQVIAIPVGGACVMGLICMLLGNVFTPHLGNPVTVLVCLVIAMMVYWTILLLLRSFREQELKYIPGSRLINAAGQILRVF